MEKTKTSSDDFDALRAKWPTFGFAVYAYTPGGLVIVEAIRHTTTAVPSPFSGQILDDEVIQARGATLVEAVANLDATLGGAPTKQTSAALSEALVGAMTSAPSWRDAPDESKPDPDIFG